MHNVKIDFLHCTSPNKLDMQEYITSDVLTQLLELKEEEQFHQEEKRGDHCMFPATRGRGDGSSKSPTGSSFAGTPSSVTSRVCADAADPSPRPFARWGRYSAPSSAHRSWIHKKISELDWTHVNHVTDPHCWLGGPMWSM